MAKIYFDIGEKTKIRQAMYDVPNKVIPIRFIKKYNYNKIFQQYTHIINVLSSLISEYCYEYYTIYCDISLNDIGYYRINMRVYDKQYFDIIITFGYEDNNLYNNMRIIDISEHILATSNINYQNDDKARIIDIVTPLLNTMKYSSFTKSRQMVLRYHTMYYEPILWLFNNYHRLHYGEEEYIRHHKIPNIYNKKYRETSILYTNNHYIRDIQYLAKYIIYKINNHRSLYNITVMIKLLSDQIEYVLHDLMKNPNKIPIVDHNEKISSYVMESSKYPEMDIIKINN